MVRTTSLALLALVACKLESTPPDSEKVEAKLAEMFEETTGVKPEKVECPEGGLKGEVKCTAFAGEGLDITLNVDITKGEGGVFGGWDLKFETENAIVGKVLAENIKKDLSARGLPIQSVTCPPLHKQTPELRFQCMAKTADGEVAIEVLAAADGVNYKVVQP